MLAEMFKAGMAMLDKNSSNSDRDPHLGAAKMATLSVLEANRLYLRLVISE